MKRHFTALIIIACSLLLAGCSGHAGKENAEETGQLPVNQAAEDDSLGMKEPEPMAGKEGPAYRWQEMPDLEVGYIPELGYHPSFRICPTYRYPFICWKDTLILGDAIYRRENESYKRTEETLQDWLNIKDDLCLYQFNQWENFLVVDDNEHSQMIIFDMDSKQLVSYPFEHGYNWHIFQGKIYYREWDKVLCMDIVSGEVEVVYACEGGGAIRIRNNGDMIISTGNKSYSKVWEFWLLMHDAEGDIDAKKICETDQYEFTEMLEFNSSGLFLIAEFYGYGSDRLCLKDNGEIEEMADVTRWSAGQIIVEEGYFLWDSQMLSEEEKKEILGKWHYDRPREAETVVDSISYYDFQGNKLKTWRLIEDEMLEAGYRLTDILYGNGEILAFYENEEFDDLYISKVRPWEAEGTDTPRYQ